MPSTTNERQQDALLRVFQTKEQTRAFYNKISHVYDLLSESSEAPVRNCCLAMMKAAAGESVLEIGCGTGHSVVAMAKAVGARGRAHGLDLSDQMLKRTKLKLAKADLLDRVTLRRGDATQLPWADNSMDAVFMSFTLELFDTPEIPIVLRECRRVLRTEGRIAVAGLSKAGVGKRAIKMYEWGHQHFPHLLDCRPIYVRAALEQAGFKIQKALRKRMWVPVEIILGTK